MKLLINFLKCMVVLVLFFWFDFLFYSFFNCFMFDRKLILVGIVGLGKFELKNECYKEFNFYFYYYCRID